MFIELFDFDFSFVIRYAPVILLRAVSLESDF